MIHTNHRDLFFPYHSAIPRPLVISQKPQGGLFYSLPHPSTLVPQMLALFTPSAKSTHPHSTIHLGP